MVVAQKEPPKKLAKKLKIKRSHLLLIAGFFGLAVLFLPLMFSFDKIKPVSPKANPGKVKIPNSVEPYSRPPHNPGPSMSKRETDMATMGTDTEIDESGTSPNSHIHFNGWIEDRDVANAKPQSSITSNADYYFTADVSLATYVSPSGIRELPSELLKTIQTAEKDGRQKVHAFFRPLIIGRGLQYVNRNLTAEIWSEGKWVAYPKVDEMVPFDLDISKISLFSEDDMRRRAVEPYSSSALEARLGGIRFPVQRTNENGCAAILLSLWSESKMPLGRLIFPVEIGNAQCSLQSGDKESKEPSFANLLWERNDLSFDGALEIADYSFGHKTESIAVYVPRNPGKGCASFAWKTPRSIGSLLATEPFNRLLARAINHVPDERERSGYSQLARFLYDSVFLRNEGEDVSCGSRAAVQNIQAFLENGDRSIFVRVLNLENSNVFLPLGIMFLVADDKGRRFFARTPMIEEPLVSETYKIAEGVCLGELAFSIPYELKEWPERISSSYPSWVEVLPDTKKLGDYMLRKEPPPDQSSLFLLLGHHGGAQVFFGDPDDYWEATDDNIARPFRPGSAAMLDACSMGSVQTAGLNMIEQLNVRGFDALIFSPFDVPIQFGAPFAQHFADKIIEARKANRSASIATIFIAAKMATLSGKTGRDLEDAEGDASDFVLAGNSSLHLCAAGG